jgi:Spy/CpxP family protein refolding chaperone
MKHLLTVNKILVIITTVLGLSLCSLVVSAAPERGERRPPPQHGQKGGPEKMVEELKISQDQQAAFLTIMKEQHKKRMDLRVQYRDSREEGRQAMQVLHQQTVERLEDVLSAAQVSQFETLVEANRPPRRH